MSPGVWASHKIHVFWKSLKYGALSLRPNSSDYSMKWHRAWWNVGNKYLFTANNAQNVMCIHVRHVHPCFWQLFVPPSHLSPTFLQEMMLEQDKIYKLGIFFNTASIISFLQNLMHESLKKKTQNLQWLWYQRSWVTLKWIKTECSQRQTVLTNTGFTNCSWAHLVISFISSCVWPSGEPLPILMLLSVS